MAIFKRGSRKPPPKSIGHVGDDALLAQIAARSDLSLPRHWVHYLYCADEGSARSAATAITDEGWEIQAVDASVEGPGWVVIAERRGAITSPAAVQDARTFFESVASHVDGGDYDGWEASI